MMQDVDTECPEFENGKYQLRYIEEADCHDLLLGFKEADTMLTGHDGTAYDFYFVAVKSH